MITNKDLLHQLLDIKEVLTLFINSQIKIMADLTELQKQVEETKSVEQSAITLIQGLKAKLDEAGTDPEKLKALSDSLSASDKALSDAVAANTPATAPPVPTQQPGAEAQAQPAANTATPASQSGDHTVSAEAQANPASTNDAPSQDATSQPTSQSTGQ